MDIFRRSAFQLILMVAIIFLLVYTVFQYINQRDFESLKHKYVSLPFDVIKGAESDDLVVNNIYYVFDSASVVVLGIDYTCKCDKADLYTAYLDGENGSKPEGLKYLLTQFVVVPGRHTAQVELSVTQGINTGFNTRKLALMVTQHTQRKFQGVPFKAIIDFPKSWLSKYQKPAGDHEVITRLEKPTPMAFFPVSNNTVVIDSIVAVKKEGNKLTVDVNFTTDDYDAESRPWGIYIRGMEYDESGESTIIDSNSQQVPDQKHGTLRLR